MIQLVKVKKIFFFERKSIILDPDEDNNIKKSEISDHNIYNIDDIRFYESEEGFIEICIYRDYDETGYECKENLSKLKEKYEFLDWITNSEQFVNALEKLNEKKRIKINLCLDKILIYISILYTKLDGEVEEMKFLLKYNDVEKKDLLEMILLEMIKMKENENKLKEKNESFEGSKDIEKEE